MGGENLWKILCKPVENLRILILFPSFNAYETDLAKSLFLRYTFVAR